MCTHQSMCFHSCFSWPMLMTNLFINQFCTKNIFMWWSFSARLIVPADKLTGVKVCLSASHFLMLSPGYRTSGSSTKLKHKRLLSFLKCYISMFQEWVTSRLQESSTSTAIQKQLILFLQVHVVLYTCCHGKHASLLIFLW